MQRGLLRLCLHCDWVWYPTALFYIVRSLTQEGEGCYLTDLLQGLLTECLAWCAHFNLSPNRHSPHYVVRWLHVSQEAGRCCMSTKGEATGSWASAINPSALLQSASGP
jgi:hypothetical protein